MLFTQILLFLLVGLGTGLIAGLFGVGGGLILVPVQIFIYGLIGMPPEVQMKLAIGTSLSTVVFNTLVSSRAQAKRDSILWPLIYKIAVGIVIGALLGVFLTRLLPGRVLELIFGIVILIISCYLFFIKGIHEDKSHKLPNFPIINLIGVFISTVATLLGTGGGYLTVPILVRLGVPIHKAIGSSSAIGFMLSLIGSLAFIIPEGSGVIYPYAMGYIYLPAFIPFVIGGCTGAPFGVKMAHSLPRHKLKRVYAIGLFIIGVLMIVH